MRLWFGALLIVQLLFVVGKRLQKVFYDAAAPALWWQLEVAYAIYMYVWGTIMFILAKPDFYPGAVTLPDSPCDLYNHPMAPTMWIVAEITCTGAGLGLLLLILAHAWDSWRAIGAVLVAQLVVQQLWSRVTVDVVAPRWTRSLA